MRTSLKSFGLGLILSTVLLYLILVAQFRSYKDPLIILLTLPPVLAGVVLTLLATGTTIQHPDRRIRAPPHARGTPGQGRGD